MNSDKQVRRGAALVPTDRAGWRDAQGQRGSTFRITIYQVKTGATALRRVTMSPLTAATEDGWSDLKENKGDRPPCTHAVRQSTNKMGHTNEHFPTPHYVCVCVCGRVSPTGLHVLIIKTRLGSGKCFKTALKQWYSICWDHVPVIRETFSTSSIIL